MRAMTVALLSLACLAMLACGSTAWAQTADIGPTIDLPAGSLNMLTTSDHDSIKAYLQYYFKQIAGAADTKAIDAARAKLADGYKKYDSGGYRFAYAQDTAATIVPTLQAVADSNGGPKVAKLVALGSFVASMPEGSIKPALDEMVKSPAQPLRYFGWQSYAAVREMVMAQGQKETDSMLATMKDAAAKEDSPPVLAALLTAMSFPLTPTGGATEKSLAKAQATVMEALQANWPRYLQVVADGNDDMPLAIRAGIPALRMLGQTVASDKAGKAKVMQMLLNAMYAASQAYARAGGEGSTADLNRVLIMDCEDALVSLSGVSKKPAATALNNTRATSAYRVSSVQLAIIREWPTELKAMGVVAPKAPATSGPTSGSRPSRP